MANTTLGAVTLHDGTNSIIQERAPKKESVLAPMPLYLNDSDETDIFDFGGVVKTITFTGVYYHAGGISNIKTWVDSVFALIQGHQDPDAGYPLTLVDDLVGTIKVKVLDFMPIQTEGETTKITWTLKLLEASENA